MSMKHTKRMKRLLERMAGIEAMERGKLCQMGGRPHYNHQTWRDGRNEVRYVPKGEVAGLKKDIAGYQLYTLTKSSEPVAAKEKRKNEARIQNHEILDSDTIRCFCPAHRHELLASGPSYV